MSQINSSIEALTGNTDKHHESLEIGDTNKNVGTKKEPPEHKAKPPGGLVGILVTIQAASNTVFEEHSKQLNCLCYVVLHVALIAYFGWTTKYFMDQQDLVLGSTMCRGYGFLMIIFILVNIGVAYSWIIKPYLLPAFNNTIWKPVKHCFREIFKSRWAKFLAYGLVFGSLLAYLVIDARDDLARLMPLSGLVSYFLIGLLMCNNPARIKWRPVIWGFLLQFSFGLLTIRWEVGRNIFACIGDRISTFLGYANEGAAFVYGDFLIRKEIVFVFQALSAIYFLSFFVNILYHYGIMQKVITGIGEFLQAILGTTICESVNGAANIFLGMTEAPLLIKPYLEDLTNSEIFSIMSTGFSTVAGTVLAAYISFGAEASHLITSSVMSAPAALCFTKLVYPETEITKATKESIAVTKSEYASALDAASSGATTALELVLGITANLIAFISFLFFLNGVLGFMGELVGYSGEDIWTIERFVGYFFMPICYMMGVPWDECEKVGRLVGLKTIVNEFAAYKEMGQTELRPRTKIITTYALCGFSNPGSIGIMISSLSVLMPKRRELVTQLVFRAFLSGIIICFMTACIAALLIPGNLE